MRKPKPPLRNARRKTSEPPKPKIKKPPILPKILRSIFLLIIFLIVTAVVDIVIKTKETMTASSTLPLRTITIVVKGSHITSDTVGDLIHSQLKGNFLFFDGKVVKQSLLSLPWVDHVSLRRIWPDALIITIVERKAVAIWKKNALLDQHLHLFYPDPKTFPTDVPELSGPNSQIHAVFKRYLEINHDLEPLHLFVTHLNVSERSAWKMKLSNHIIVFIGASHANDRLLRFIRLYPKIIGDRGSEVIYVDLRYPSGIAVRWKHAN